MIGYHSVSVMADAMAKELQVLITKRLLMLQNIPADELGKAYKQNGYFY
jgi:hypothetical protein